MEKRLEGGLPLLKTLLIFLFNVVNCFAGLFRYCPLAMYQVKRMLYHTW